MKTKLCLLFFAFIALFISCHTASAQKGKFYLTHYEPDNEQLTNENFAIIQDFKGEMLFANSKGVLKFDGRFWELINTPGSALSLATNPNTKETYVGCINDFGIIKTDANGIDTYYSLLNEIGQYHVFSKTLCTEKFAYFLASDGLFELDHNTQSITNRWDVYSGYSISQIFKIGNTLFLLEANKGLMRIDNKKLVAVDINTTTLGGIAFASSIDMNSALVGTNEGYLYLFNGLSFTKLNVEDTDYIKNSQPTDALITNGMVAVSTNKGGVVLFNLSTGKNISTINFYSGLPDDEIYSIGVDSKSGLWIAHEFGLTRVDYFLPFKNFSAYPGLEGNISSALLYQNKLFVGTNEGLFYLDEVKDYVQLEKVVKKKKPKKDNLLSEKNSDTDSEKASTNDKRNILGRLNNLFAFARKKKVKNDTTSVSTQSTEAEAKSSDTIPKTRKKRFLGIFGKKDKAPIQDSKPSLSNEQAKAPQESPLPKKAENTPKPRAKPKQTAPTPVTAPAKQEGNFELQSVKYIYTKIEGINAKVRQLVTYGNKLLVATNKGIFEINGTNAKKISDESIIYLLLSADKNKLWASTDSKKVLVMALEGGEWKEQARKEGFSEKITNIAQGKSDEVWLAESNYIIKYRDLGLTEADTFSVNNPYSDFVHLISSGEKMYVFMSAKAYVADEKAKRLTEDTTLLKTNQDFLKIIHSEPGTIWYQSRGQWMFFSSVIKDNPNFIYLGLFKALQHVFINEDKTIAWVVTKGNNLYKFDISSPSVIKNTSNIFLRYLYDKEGNPLKINEIELKQESGNVSFSFISPEFLDNSSLQYQFKLEGLSNNWSEWSSDNQVNFNYLPSGDYKLFIRTKNALNQVQESAPISFKVKPPYWQEWWFFLGEFFFFGTLLGLSIWLNNHGNHKNLWISKVLTFLTIVMMIEFVNTVFESYLKFADSPVLSFLVQVTLAIMIFPFERVLSSFIKQDPAKALKKVSILKGKKTDNGAEPSS